MDTLKLLSLLAALGLASVASAQDQAPLEPTDSPPAQQTTPQPVAPRIVGLQVESPGGEQLGSVIDVVADENGEPAYAVISTGNDTATAVPYATVSPMIRDNKVVLDRTRLQNSPQVAQADLQDKGNTKWRLQADRYWGAATIRSASPGREPTPADR